MYNFNTFCKKQSNTLFSYFFPPNQDVTHKIVDAIGAIAGSSLEQTTWLRRNLEVKPSPKIMVDGNNLESDVEGELFPSIQSPLSALDIAFIDVCSKEGFQCVLSPADPAGAVDFYI